MWTLTTFSRLFSNQVDSGGAFLPLQAEIFPDVKHGGRSFRNQVDLPEVFCEARVCHEQELDGFDQHF